MPLFFQETQLKRANMITLALAFTLFFRTNLSKCLTIKKLIVSLFIGRCRVRGVSRNGGEIARRYWPAAEHRLCG